MTDNETNESAALPVPQGDMDFGAAAETALASADGVLSMCQALSVVERQSFVVELDAINSQVKALRGDVVWLVAKLEEMERAGSGPLAMVDVHKQLLAAIAELRKHIELYNRVANKAAVSVRQIQTWVDGVWAAVREECSDPEECERIIERIRALTSRSDPDSDRGFPSRFKPVDATVTSVEDP